jgi:hypothetical protein
MQSVISRRQFTKTLGGAVTLTAIICMPLKSLNRVALP